MADAVGIAIGNVHRSYYAVYPAGSSDTLPLAEAAWQAAMHIHDWAATRHPNNTQAIVELDVLRRKLNKAAKAFADAVRKETAG